jgi:hypothetical protein
MPCGLKANFYVCIPCIAKKTEADRKSGGSPTPLDECIALLLGASLNNATRKSIGTSLNDGILYVDGPRVNKYPLGNVTNSSNVHHPTPCTNAPSTCPIYTNWSINILPYAAQQHQQQQQQQQQQRTP